MRPLSTQDFAERAALPAAQVPPKVCFTIMKERDVRLKLQEVGLPDHGSRSVRSVCFTRLDTRKGPDLRRGSVCDTDCSPTHVSAETHTRSYTRPAPRVRARCRRWSGATATSGSTSRRRSTSRTPPPCCTSRAASARKACARSRRKARRQLPMGLFRAHTAASIHSSRSAGGVLHRHVVYARRIRH